MLLFPHENLHDFLEGLTHVVQGPVRVDHRVLQQTPVLSDLLVLHDVLVALLIHGLHHLSHFPSLFQEQLLSTNQTSGLSGGKIAKKAFSTYSLTKPNPLDADEKQGLVATFPLQRVALRAFDRRMKSVGVCFFKERDALTRLK